MHTTKTITMRQTIISVLLLIVSFYLSAISANTQTAGYNYATGNVHGRNHVGGLIGRASGESGHINNSYARGQVTGTSHVGGFAGSNDVQIENSYSTGKVNGDADVGGFVGSGEGTVHGAYWDTQTSGQTISAGGEGRSTSDITYPYGASTFTDWDFTNIWQHDLSPQQNDGYPMILASDVFLLTLRVDPPGAGNVMGTGYYKSNLNVEVNTIPNSGFEFEGWYQDGLLMSEQPNYSVTMNNHTILVARFETVPVYIPIVVSQPSINVYPNPANTHFWVEITTQQKNVYDVSLTNLAGQTIINQKIDPSFTNKTLVDINRLKPGLYLVVLHNQDGVWTRKILIH